MYKRQIIKVYDLFECLPFKGKLMVPRSHFFRGYLAGVFKNLFEANYTVKEIACIAKGDPYCRFIVARKEREF